MFLESLPTGLMDSDPVTKSLMQKYSYITIDDQHVRAELQSY